MKTTNAMLKTFPFLQAIVIGTLLCAVLVKCPYGHYTVLKFVCGGGLSYLAFLAFKSQKIGWAWSLGITALVYFPFITLQLVKPMWTLVNIATIVMTFASAVVLRRRAS